jgi:hypothetical protein
MSEALIDPLDRDESRAFVPLRAHDMPQPVLVAFTRNSRRSIFLSYWVPRMVQLPMAWLNNLERFFTLHDYTSNMKVHMVVF